MLRKIFKWVGIVVGSLLGIALVAVIVIYFMAEARLTKTYDIPDETVPIPAQVTTTARTWPLTAISFCEGCHGENLAGEVALDDNIGRLAPPNLTSGKGGVGSWYTDADWVRSLRHGVRPSGKPLLGMPSELWNKLGDEDLGIIIAYVKSVPPVDNELPKTELRLVGHLMLGVGMIPPGVISAEVIDHAAPRPPEPERGVTVEYGKYLTRLCTICHGEDLSGGFLQGEGRNLTPAGDLAKWTEEDFIETMRTGIAPDGEELDGELFPWEDLGQMTDDELKAIWLYLKSVPPAVSTPPPTRPPTPQE